MAAIIMTSLVDDLVHKVSVCSGTAVQQQQQRAAAWSVLVCGRPVLVQLDGDATGSGGVAATWSFWMVAMGSGD
jgi:hypothetical protein